jgi:RND superfamily putative drug exporter
MPPQPAPKTSTTGPPRQPSLAKLIFLSLLVVALTVLSVSLYWVEHHKGHHPTVLGETDNPDHVTLTVLIQKIDPSTARISAQLELKGAGSLVDEHTHELKEDATLISNAVSNRTLVSKAHQRPEFVSVQFALRDGIITDYPFDSYTANFFFHVLVGDGPNQRVVPVMLAIAAGTDYGIFLIGRYREAHLAGQDPVTAYYTTIRSVTPVIVGSGLTIAGASATLYFTRLPYFHSMAIPVATGMIVVVAAALTLGPAVVVVASRFGLLVPKNLKPGRFWRRTGIAVVRWPAPIMVGSGAVILVGLAALPGFKPGYDDRHYLPKDTPVNVGYAAAERHFTAARMAPDITMVEATHDMRNPADMLVLDRVAKNIMRVVGIGMIQDITRPLGIPLQHSSVPFQLSASNQLIIQNMKSLKDRVKDIDTISLQLDRDIGLITQMYTHLEEIDKTTHDLAGVTQDTTAVTDEIRDHFADFDDFWRPLRSYFYWEKHCFDVPMCWSFRSLFESLDGVDKLSEKLHMLSTDVNRLDFLLPQVTELLPAVIDTLNIMRSLVVTVHSTLDGFVNQLEDLSDTQIMMGQSFDDSKNDDFFYLPAEAFDNKDFQTGLRLFMSPDGKSARFFVTQQTYPATLEGIKRVEPERTAAQEAVKQSSLSDAKVYVGGMAALYEDMQEGAKYDLIMAIVASLTLIFLIMTLITRSFVAAVVIVGTASSSIASSFGISVLIWQDILGQHIYWVTLVLSVIVLLAVGSDYNLLLVSRFEEEIHVGLKTGYIRAMGGSGGVVTSAGMVFAFTMLAMLGSDLRAIGMFGSTVCIGLLLDTFVVRARFMPSIATLLGRWFWWPQVVNPRGPNKVRGIAAHAPSGDEDTDKLALGSPSQR